MRLKGIDLLRNKIHAKPDIFSCIKILQHASRLFGINYHKNGFGFNLDSLVFAAMVIWYSGCFFGIKLCWAECDRQIIDKRLLIMMCGVRTMQLGSLICVIKFCCSNVQLNQLLYFGDWHGEQTANFKSFKYHRRNFVIITIFSAWLLCKLVQLMEIVEGTKWNRDLSVYYEACTYMNSWPLMMLSWQFLVWMQIFSRAWKISLDKLHAVISNLREIPVMRHEAQITESITRVRLVLEFKEKILRIYGLSIIFNQLRASKWIIMSTFWYNYEKDHLKLIFLNWMLLMNVTICFLPHWVGQEISSEVSFSPQLLSLFGNFFSFVCLCFTQQK